MFIKLTSSSGIKTLCNINLIQRILDFSECNSSSSHYGKGSTWISGLNNNGGIYFREDIKTIEQKIRTALDGAKCGNINSHKISIK